MTDTTLQTTAPLPDATPLAVDDAAPPDADTIDPRRVARLTMYSREALYLVDLADGRQRQIAPDDWHALVHAVVSHPDSRLSPVTAGRYDVIWRVDWTAREED